MCHVQRADLALDPQLAGRLPGCLSGSRACRSLFGPVDHVELRQELQLRLREIQEESCRRWSFDFQHGVPLSGARFAWEEAAGDNMPDFYRDKDCEERPGPPEGHMPCLEGNEAPQEEEEEPPNTALTATTGSTKRKLLTDFYPVRKKTKDTKALCDNACVESAVPNEQTPQEPLR